ncbi:hypothetical protein ACN469_07150 [Corallococcus terminator]
MKLAKIAVLIPVALLNAALFGCGGVSEESADDSSKDSAHYLDISHLDGAAREEFLANHKHEVSAKISESPSSEVPGGEDCYCSYCKVHHAPHCV